MGLIEEFVRYAGELAAGGTHGGPEGGEVEQAEDLEPDFFGKVRARGRN